MESARKRQGKKKIGPDKRQTGSWQMAREIKSPLGNVPWTLQQFFKGQIDLDAELVRRFPTMPLMTLIRFRQLGSSTDRRVASMSSQDGSAMVVVDANTNSKEIQFSFTYGSMLTLRFHLDDLSDMDRARWLDLMRRKQSGLAFMWGQSRWNNDYAICVLRKHYVSFLAFSPNNFEAAVRIAPGVKDELIICLEQLWGAAARPTRRLTRTSEARPSGKPRAPEPLPELEMPQAKPVKPVPAPPARPASVPQPTADQPPETEPGPPAPVETRDKDEDDASILSDW